MEILSRLQDAATWQVYLAYKVEHGHLTRQEETRLSTFIDEQRYLPVVQGILEGKTFPPPRKAIISKMHSLKKRIVYIYPEDENLVLKLMTYLLLRSYNHLFPKNLYSFRANCSAKDAIGRLANTPNIQSMWGYKVDIHDYFNSIPVERMLPILKGALSDEPLLYAFLASLLTNPLVNDKGKIHPEEKGIMAGTPVSTFFANLYLADLDKLFLQRNRVYARYSDDIILFAPTRECLEQDISLIYEYLQQVGLTVNPKKECRTKPGEKWSFLGFSWHNGVIDIAPASIEKLKGKMRRKARALHRWQNRKQVKPVHAARAFIKVFNKKLLENSVDSDLTWAKWYFPTITTADSLRIIDQYAQSCIRYLATGKRTKAAYNFRYEDMKALGYISLVHRYYENPQEN